MFTGEIEVDESYFRGTRKGKRGRVADGKVPVFDLLKRNGKVYTVIIPDAKSDTLLPIIREKVKPNSIVYTDTFRSYNALDVSEFKDYRIKHSKLFAKKHNHTNDIENYLSMYFCKGFLDTDWYCLHKTIKLAKSIDFEGFLILIETV